ncbi:diguanylate cyclase [Aromatoleum diolicum]|uniref:Diguanylate cyclase n=2 Tax=Aromatoleum diolicum TaxID=75796 RepID=A0ABX1QJE6_9RHOO|nr:diguanylate cyclase [Aromatoleum diolicum]
MHFDQFEEPCLPRSPGVIPKQMLPRVVSPRRWLELTFAVLMPFAALALQSQIWGSAQYLPFVLFYPALVLSSWVGGRVGGGIAMLLSIGLVVWFFMAPTRSFFINDPSDVARLIIFIAIGLVIIYAHDRFQLRTEQYRNVTENIDDVVWVLDAETLRLLYVSPSVLKQHGYTPAEIMALPIEVALTPTLAERLRSIPAAEPEFANVVTEEAVKARKDGSTVWTEVVMSRVTNPRTGKVEVHGVSRDISARKHAEARLKASEQRMRTMLDNIPTAIACSTLGRDAELIFLNRQFVRIFGYTLEEIPDVAAWAQRAYPDERHRSSVMAPWEMTVGMASGDRASVESMESRVVCKDGTVLDVLVSADVLEDMLLVSFIDITERKQAEQRLRHMAQHDALTDLPNRVLFDEHVGVALAVARRDQTRFGLMFIDLDKFKEVNDSMGHRIGDLLLREVGQRLRHAVRESDIPARIGGDEFVVLLRNVHHADHALLVGEKIRAILSAPFTIESHTFSISASIGIALYPDHGADAIELARSADAAMYRAKEGGRDTVVLLT